MKEFDNDCLIMARIQGEIFEKSIHICKSSSAVFIKRYMNSMVARSMDRESFLLGTISDIQAIDFINESFPNDYGKTKYSKEEMYWIGYIYRVWAYVYDQRSKDIIKISSPNRMRDLYYIYHTLDPIVTINRILEASGIDYSVSLLDKSKKLILENC